LRAGLDAGEGHLLFEPEHNICKPTAILDSNAKHTFWSCEGVATALAPSLTRRERTLLAKRHTENAEAHEAYLRGRYFFGKRTREGFEKGIDCFTRAIRIDANYGLAYSGLADCYGLLGTHGVLTQQCNLKAEQAAVRAIALDPGLGEAYASLGHQKLRQWDWPAAERAFVQSIRLNGNYAVVHNWYAVYLQLVGQTDQSLRENALALELDPMSVAFRSTRGKLLYFARRYEEALEQLHGALALDHHFYLALYYSGLVYEAVGLYDRAIDAPRENAFCP
jgi:tetratricopeptide (TPR) repeat protein